MKFNCESEEEKLRCAMKISPRKKLEWLYEMNRLAVKCLPAKIKKIRLKLRQPQ